MKREEKINILAALDIAINRCNQLAEESDDEEEKHYQWGQSDGLYNASQIIACRPED